MEYVTHKRGENDYQPLKEHSLGVAQFAAEFAEAFGAGEHARRTGTLHDIGKYSQNGQRRQRDPEHTPKVDHSTAGAQEAFKLGDSCAAFAIAGHHGGLPDLGGKADLVGGTLGARLQKKLIGGDDPSAWRGELTTNEVARLPDISTPPYSLLFYTRMLFSCLVDADYLNTEGFMRGEQAAAERGGGEPIKTLLHKLCAHIGGWLAKPRDELCRARNRVLSQCLKGDAFARGLYTLTVPTGGGKTIASLAFALSHAQEHGLKRVIYVVPYTSIIEQNAEVFREILGDENVLEHYATADPDDEGGDDLRAQRRRMACENWDAPVVVTTAVQFFESLYAAKPSRCRKLHNIANSVVVFDEAQMLPVPCLKPCVSAIAELVTRYGVTALLCTATQPALDGLFAEAMGGRRPREICHGVDEMYDFFRRVRFVREGVLTNDELARRMNGQSQTLCVVNARERAKSIYEKLQGEGCFYLSTLMTPADRSAALTEIRARLREKRPCRVVSTSLIEAGVDVDFPTVWRELAGLDSILQAAGRCNREGRNPVDDSFVHIFIAEDEPPRIFEQNIAAAKKTLEAFEQINSRDAIAFYFERLLDMRGDTLDMQGIAKLCESFAFQSIEREFHMIESDTRTVYIPMKDSLSLLERLRRGERSRKLVRSLGRYAVNVYPQHFDALRNAGALEDLPDDGCAILIDAKQYSPACGLALDVQAGNGLFI